MNDERRKTKDERDGRLPTALLAGSPIRRFAGSSTHRAFTLMELLVVIGIIVVLAAFVVPAIKSLTKSNDITQSGSLVRSMLSAARSIAVSQHRQAGVVFFEEHTNNSGKPYNLPMNRDRTAMQIFVEDYNQAQYAPVAAGNTVFIAQSGTRQYLPAGIMLAALNDDPNAMITGQAGSGTSLARAIIFDASGNMVTRNGLARPDLGNGASGTYPFAYGDWNFNSAGTTASNAVSSPGFFLFNMNDFLNRPQTMTQTQWLMANADVIIVNANTGLLIDAKR